MMSSFPGGGGCLTSLVSRNDGGLMKSRVNALRLMWRAKFSSVRRWQDFTRRSHVERFQEQLDEAQSQFEAIQAEKEEDLAALWSLIGAQKVCSPFQYHNRALAHHATT